MAWIGYPLAMSHFRFRENAGCNGLLMDYSPVFGIQSGQKIKLPDDRQRNQRPGVTTARSIIRGKLRTQLIVIQRHHRHPGASGGEEKFNPPHAA